MVLCDDGAPDVGDRDAQVARGEVQAGDEAELAGEGDLDRASSAARAHRCVENAGCRQLLDDVRHRRGGEPRRTRELDLREVTVVLERVHNPGAVGFAQ